MKVKEAFEKLVVGEVKWFVMQNRNRDNIMINVDILNEEVVSRCDTAPTTKEVEITRYISVSPDGVEEIWLTKTDAETYGGQVVEVKWNCTQPVPRKIKRRVELLNFKVYTDDGTTVPDGARIFAEYEEEV